jgi:hypothetical protein
MHHLKETTIDGVKFVLIPADLHDALAQFVWTEAEIEGNPAAFHAQELWNKFDPEVFHEQ